MVLVYVEELACELHRGQSAVVAYCQRLIHRPQAM
jgi:hypothetical protein